jgi:plasmid stabilization system protein ParE
VARVEWSDLAFADLDRLDAFLRPKNPRAADDAYFAIYEAARHLEDFPEMGRPVPDMPRGYRELPVPYSNSGYLILYYFDQWVSVVRIRHQSEAGY